MSGRNNWSLPWLPCLLAHLWTHSAQILSGYVKG